MSQQTTESAGFEIPRVPHLRRARAFFRMQALQALDAMVHDLSLTLD